MTGEPTNGNQPPTPPLSPERILEVLNCGTVREEHGMLRWSSNYTFLVSVTDADVSLNAVYKPQRGERPLWDFPDGTLCYREVASYIMSSALGWQIVPPTVLRNGPRGLGSLQLYIQHDPEVNYFSLDERCAPQLRRIAAFDYIVNNADRKGGHMLLDPNDHLWGIDHGIAFNAVPKLRTVIWDYAGQPIPDEIIRDMERVYADVDNVQSQIRLQIDKLLSDVEVSAFLARMRRLIQRREYPRPGPGPNYPWPPV